MIRKITITLTASFLIFLMLSCSQKYDDTGIFEPSDPDHSADTLLAVSGRFAAFPSDIISDGYIHIGTDTGETGDTLSSSVSLVRFSIPETEGLDSAYITYRINMPDMSVYENTAIDVSHYAKFWDRDDFDIDHSLLNHFATIPLKSDSSLSALTFRIDLTAEMLNGWANTTSDSSYATLLLESSSDPHISPILKMYSSRWPSESLKPSVNTYYTLDDSLITFKSPVSDDMSLVFKKTDTDSPEGKVKIGGVSGESYITKFDLSSIPSGAVVLTGRIDMAYAENGRDPVYGGIETQALTDEEIFIYVLTDGLWETDIDSVSYDSLNVWQYKLKLSGVDNFFSMDTVIQNWIREPDDNHGILIRSEKWGSPFGYTTFREPRLNVSYIIPGGSE